MDEISQIMKALFGGVWGLLSGVTLPGFGISAAKVLIGFFVIRWSLNLLALFTGFHTNVGFAADRMRPGNETAQHYRQVWNSKNSPD